VARGSVFIGGALAGPSPFPHAPTGAVASRSPPGYTRRHDARAPPLLLALACASDAAGAPPDAEAVEVRVHVFARLPPAEAAQLEGRRALYRVNVTGEQAGVVFDIDAPGDEVAVLTLPVIVHEDALTVAAELHLDYFPAKVGKDGTPFPATWGYRLEKAVLVGP
jgi:hypothetical protein